MPQDETTVTDELAAAIEHLENAHGKAPGVGTRLMIDELIEDADELHDRTVRLYQK